MAWRFVFAIRYLKGRSDEDPTKSMRSDELVDKEGAWGVTILPKGGFKRRVLETCWELGEGESSFFFLSRVMGTLGWDAILALLSLKHLHLRHSHYLNTLIQSVSSQRWKLALWTLRKLLITCKAKINRLQLVISINISEYASNKSTPRSIRFINYFFLYIF